MAKLWKYGMIIFLLSSLFFHKEDDLMMAIMETPSIALDLVLTLVLSASLWNGFLHIIEKSGFMNYLSFLLKPILKMIYGSIILKDDIYACISSNIIANLLGLGTLATVSGLKAFQKLQQYNSHDYPSREMMTLVIMNTVGMTLFPSSLFMLRKQFESQSIYQFYPYMIIISLSILVIGLLVQRMIDHE